MSEDLARALQLADLFASLVKWSEDDHAEGCPLIRSIEDAPSYPKYGDGCPLCDSLQELRLLTDALRPGELSRGAVMNCNARAVDALRAKLAASREEVARLEAIIKADCKTCEHNYRTEGLNNPCDECGSSEWTPMAATPVDDKLPTIEEAHEELRAAGLEPGKVGREMRIRLEDATATLAESGEEGG